jgi:hypothetical protein
LGSKRTWLRCVRKRQQPYTAQLVVNHRPTDESAGRLQTVDPQLLPEGRICLWCTACWGIVGTRFLGLPDAERGGSARRRGHTDPQARSEHAQTPVAQTGIKGAGVRYLSTNSRTSTSLFGQEKHLTYCVVGAQPWPR